MTYWQDDLLASIMSCVVCVHIRMRDSLKEQSCFPTLPSVASRGVALADSEVEGLARNPGRYSLPYAGTE